MTVLDASVVVDALVAGSGRGDAARARLSDLDTLAGPYLLDAEFLSALRALVRREEISGSVAQRARTQFAMLPVDRYPFAPFEGRIWQLRDQLTAYDAWYVALAEMLGTEFVTADARLRRARGPRCAVVAP